MDKIPLHLKQLFSDKTIPMSKKMTAVNLFLPNPDPNEIAKTIYNENYAVGETLVKLIKEKKIRFEKPDSNFKIKVTHL